MALGWWGTSSKPIPSKLACRRASRRAPTGSPHLWKRASSVTRYRLGAVQGREEGERKRDRGLGRGLVRSPQP